MPSCSATISLDRTSAKRPVCRNVTTTISFRARERLSLLFDEEGREEIVANIKTDRSAEIQRQQKNTPERL